MTYSSLESEYLIHLLCCAIKKEQPQKAPENLDWKGLVELSKKQQVYSVIVPVIDLASVPTEIAQELQMYFQNELLRTLAMKNELEEIEKELVENEIKYMLLKGCVIRNYYPLQKMRQMSDYDILYDPSKRENLISLMKKRGFYLKSAEANSDDFYKKPYYNFEFHRNLFDERDAFCPDFDLWKRAKPSGENKFKYSINDEDCLIYSLCHTFDHYCVSGCGIRFIVDIYVLLNGLNNLDWNYINKTVEDFGFADFCKNAIGLSNALFNNKPPTKEEKDLFDFMMSGGIYGTNSISKLIDESGGSRFKYFIGRIFPPKRQMYANYPKLKKAPILLPFYYAFRLIQRAYYNYDGMKKELKGIKSYHSQDNSRQ